MHACGSAVVGHCKQTMIVGGTDTSAMSLTRVMEDLLREPKYLQMAHQELDQVVGHDRKVEESDLPNLPLLRAIIKESWRRSTFGSGMLLPRCATHLRHAGGRLRHPRQHHSPGEHPRHFPRSSRLARPPSLLPRKIPAKVRWIHKSPFTFSDKFVGQSTASDWIDSQLFVRGVLKDFA